MVDFAGAKFGDFADDFELARKAEVGMAGGLDRFADFGKGKGRLVGDGDELLAFLGIGLGKDGDFGSEAVVFELAGESVFNGGEADHFSADFGEAF